ncbi:MAG: Gfo/Idh/MocA family oxidoreductase [Gemmatimonadetes bacterium]|nr:Gfo/Idh/MocA family oxidoreductase [Gemmatimonadota bacterium]
MSDPIRLGLLGAGAVAQLVHLPVLSRLRGVQLVAICDNDRVKARALADRFGALDAFTDIEDLLEFDALDAVIIATPNHLHEPHVLAALSRGAHVLCERPLALSSKGVERILAAAVRHDRKVVVGNNHRFRTDVQALSRFLHGGELGKLTGVRAGAYHPAGAIGGWRRNRPEAGGGAFLEHGFQLLDLALWLADFPDPVRVSAFMDRPRGAKAVEESMLVVLEAAGGLACTFDVSWSYHGEEERWWFEALAARGSARLAPLRVIKELNGKAVDVSPTGGAARESATLQSYRAQDTHFLSVLAGESPYKPPTDQLVLHRALEAIYRAANEEKEIRL